MARESVAAQREKYGRPTKKKPQNDFINAVGDEARAAVSKGIDKATAEVYGEPVVKRGYEGGAFAGQSKQQSNVIDPILEQPVPEPAGFDLPPVSDDNSFSGQPAVDKNTGAPKQPTRMAPSSKPNAIIPPPASDFRNKSMDDMPNKQKTMSANVLAKTAVKFYLWLNEKGKNFTKFDEEEMVKKSIDGSVDLDVLDMELQLPNGQFGTMRNFLNDMNQGVDEAFTVRQEWVEETEGVLTQVLAANGWGMTPVQHLGELIVEDAVPKVMAMTQIKSTMNHILKTCTEQLAIQKAQSGQAAGVAAIPPRGFVPQPPPQPTTQYVPEPEPQKQPVTQQQIDINDKIRQDIDRKIEQGVEYIEEIETIELPTLNHSERVAQEKTARAAIKAKKVKKKPEVEHRESGEKKSK